jgi:SAM-dependent methyltransferase
MNLPSIEEVRAYLCTIKIIEDEVDDKILIDNEELLQIYQMDHAYRLWRSIQIITQHTPTDRPLRVLELGSAPYFFSAIMFKYFNHQVVGSNVKAGVMPRKSENPEFVTVKLEHGPDAKQDDLPVHIFNFELDHFPFEDGEFDIILCMEVIEHLAYSPTHMLAEAHRVLKPGGMLLLTTPNSISLHNTLRLMRNKTNAFAYSGYGVYGRHNREFTAKELADLTLSCGYQLKDVFLQNVYVRFKYWPIRTFLYRSLLSLTNLPIPYLANKRDYIFVIATSTGNYQFTYPNDLYYYSELYPEQK